MSTNEFSSICTKKKKKKRSFLQQQKRFAKNGSYGRGTQVSPDVYDYFINIMKVINTLKEDEEQMCILSTNVFREIQGKEVDYCCNQIISRVVENLIPYSSDKEFYQFIEKFGQNLRPIFSNPFGSHVLQQTLVVAYTKYIKCTSDNLDLKVKFNEYLLKVSKFLLNNFEDFVWDMYSNAVARTVFNVLSGNAVKNDIKFTDLEINIKSENNTSKEFVALLRQFARKILLWPNFDTLCNQPVNSLCLQSLLFACRKLDESSEIVNRIISYCENSSLNLADEDNNPATRLLEAVLTVCSEDQFEKIYKTVFESNLVKFASSKHGNFAVQKLITRCSDKEIFKEIFQKLSLCVKDILKEQFSGVLLALVKGCRTLETLQGDCIRMLHTVFDITDSKNIVPLVASLTSSRNFDSDVSTITLHGVLIIEELLFFKKPIIIVNSLLELPESRLINLLSDIKGSHITDAFIKSPTIGEKSRNRLFKKLKGHYLSLATSKHGSRTLDTIWSAISLQQKTLLAEELKANQSELCSDVYGKGFARKINLSHFRRDKEKWIHFIKSCSDVEKYFSDIVPKKKQKTS